MIQEYEINEEACDQRGNKKEQPLRPHVSAAPGTFSVSISTEPAFSAQAAACHVINRPRCCVKVRETYKIKDDK